MDQTSSEATGEETLTAVGPYGKNRIDAVSAAHCGFLPMRRSATRTRALTLSLPWSRRHQHGDPRVGVDDRGNLVAIQSHTRDFSNGTAEEMKIHLHIRANGPMAGTNVETQSLTSSPSSHTSRHAARKKALRASHVEKRGEDTLKSVLPRQAGDGSVASKRRLTNAR